MKRQQANNQLTCQSKASSNSFQPASTQPQSPLQPLRGYHTPPIIDHVKSYSSLAKRIHHASLSQLFHIPLTSQLLSQHFKSIELSRLAQVISAHGTSVMACDFDKSEHRYLLSGDNKGRVAIYDTRLPLNWTLTQTFSIQAFNQSSGANCHKRSLSSCQWYPFDTGMFITSSMDHSVGVWDTETLSLVSSFQLSAQVYCAQLSQTATHSLIACAQAQSYIRLCDLRSNTATHTLIGHRKPCVAVKWAPDSEYVLSSASMDQTIRTWDIRRPGALMLLDQHNTISPFINQHYVNHAQQTAQRDITSANGTIVSLQYTADGRFLLAASQDQRLRQYDAKSGCNTFLHYQHTHVAIQLHKLALSSDDSHIYFPARNAIHVYNRHSGELVKRLKAHMDVIHSVTVDELNGVVYSAGGDGQIVRWACDNRLQHEAVESIDFDVRNQKRVMIESAVDQDEWSDDG